MIFSLLAVSAVSAADNATSDVASVEQTDQVLNVEQTDEVISEETTDETISEETTDEIASAEENQAILNENNDVGTFDDLQIEIDNATEGSILNLTRDYNGAYGSRIQFNKDLTIDGQGHTLDCLGEGGCSAFYSNSGTITLKNLKIINGHNDFNNKGGAIHIEGSAQYTIINCTFNNNWAEDYGGAIYSAGDLDIINCTFKSNAVEDDDGGAIYCEKSVYLENCLFEKNHANVDGGAIYSKNNVNVTKNTLFIENEAKGASSSQCYGGAIRSEGNVEVNNSTFTGNNAYDYGGAIYANTASIYSSTFRENKVEADDGGAVYVESSIDVRDSGFYSNVGCVDGGAIFSKNSVNVINSNFSSNKVESHRVAVEDYGGAIRAEGDVTIEGSRFNNNFARFRGGAIECDGDLHINNTSFTSNKAYTDGGAIYCKKSVFIDNSEFADNHADVDGGAIYSKNNVDVKNTTFRDNEADDGSDDGQSESGGAILSKGDVKIDNCTFSGNHARDYGGAIYADTITWVDSPSYFKGNNVDLHDGGAIYTNKFATDVKYGVFIDNEVKSDNDGGAIYINKENHVMFTQCYFENNRCGDEGGAIYLDSTSSTLYLEYNIFVDNWAGKKGNIIYNKGEYTKIHNNWYGSNSFDFSNELVEYHFTGSESHRDDKPVKVELSLNESSTVIVRFILDGELFNYDAKFSADNGANLTNHKTGNNTVSSDITFKEGITTVTATVNHQILTLSYSLTKENVTMNINAVKISFGDNATVNIIFTPNNATGTVSVEDISSDIENGVATVIIPNLSVGNHILPVSYSGDGLYNPAQGNVTITVNRKNLNIDADAKPIQKGDNATVIVTGLENATGNVTVTINNNNWTAEINNGTATIIISGLNQNATANVSYTGDANYANASTTVSIIVNPEPKVDLTISASADPIMVGDDVIVVVTGLQNATGNVTLNIGSDDWSGEINDGTATIIVTGLTMNVTATVFYAGDYRYKNATTTVNITVNPAITVWYVNGNKESSGNGTTPDTAFKTLKEALNKAPENSTIYIAPGTYTGENNVNLTINKNLTFVNYGDGEVIFDAQSISRIWTVNAERINITGLTFKNGKEESVCGAIFFNQTLNNSYINAVFIDNNVVDGLAGAIGFYADVINTNINSIFINNSVNDGYGGAIFFNGNLNNVNITGNFTDNTADDYGGAILFYGDLNNVNITGNFTDNTADAGGAIFFNGKLTDVNISGNYNNNRANDTAGVFLFNDNLTNVIISGEYSNNLAEYCAVYYMSESATINNTSISGDYYNNTANYCVVLLIEGNISNSKISGNYNNNHAKKGICIIGEAYNLNLSGNYVNNNITNGSAIYIISCDENSIIQDSIFINNTMDDELIIDVESGSLLSLNNWFGNNATNYNIKPKVSENVAMANWLFLNVTTNITDEITINETAEITFKLYAYNSTSEEINEYDASKMNMRLDLSQRSGTLNQTTALINETISYTYRERGPATVTGKFENASYTIILAKQPTEIIVNETITLNVGESDSAGASLNPPEAGNLTYTSSNPSVAKVEDGKIIAIAEGSSIITVSFAGNDEYAAAESKNITVRVEKRIPVIIISADVTGNKVTIHVDIKGYDGLISMKLPNSLLNFTINSSLSFAQTFDPGRYNIKITALGNDMFDSCSEILTFTVKSKTSITASKVTATYGTGKKLTLTLKDAKGNPLAGKNIIVKLNGKTYKGATNAKGQFSIAIPKKLVPKTYTATLTFNGDDMYVKSTGSAVVKVVKAASKITAKKKTFKKSKKIKKYIITLKSKKTPIKKVKVTLKIKGKTYKAKTNAKGKATFKIKKLTKKGKYKAVIKFKGNKYYKATSKKAKITIK